jgi:acyl carrier protein
MNDSGVPTPADLAAELGTFLRENILADGVEVSPATELAGIGVDSFSFMEIILFVERRYSYLMPAEELTPDNMATLGALSERLHALLQSHSNA